MEPNANPPQDAVKKRKSFFSAGDTHRIELDAQSWVEVKEMNELARRKFQHQTTSEVKLKEDGDKAFSIDPGVEREALIKASVVGWDLVDLDGKPFPYSPSNRDKLANEFDPAAIDIIVEGIREHNPWMAAEDDVETLDKEIESLRKRRDRAIEAQEGN